MDRNSCLACNFNSGHPTNGTATSNIINRPIYNMRPILGVDLMDDRNRELAEVTNADDFIVSAKLVSLMLSQISENQKLTDVFPLYLRRIITMAPALIVLAIPAINPSSALVISQVGLSFGIPFALIPLVMFCRNRELMGDLVNRRATNLAAYAVVGVIVSLNVFLIYDTVLG